MIWESQHDSIKIHPALKANLRAQYKNGGVGDPPDKRIKGIDHAAAGMEDILKIWLNGPAGNDLRLIGEFDHQFVVAQWQSGFFKEIFFEIEFPETGRELQKGCRDTKSVIQPFIPKSHEIDPRIGIKVYEIAIGRTP